MKQFDSELEMIEYVVRKLDEQGKRCTVNVGGKDWCSYADGDGNHCAAGWLMTENELLAAKPHTAEECGIDFGNSLSLVITLQEAHDNTWKRAGGTFKDALLRQYSSHTSIREWKQKQVNSEAV